MYSPQTTRFLARASQLGIERSRRPAFVPSITCKLLLIGACLVTATACDLALSAQDLEQSSDTSSLRRVYVGIDVTGTVHLRPGGEENASLPLTVRGQFDYQERVIRAERPVQAFRHYRVASADIGVGQGSTHQTLPEDAKYFVLGNDLDSRSAKLQLQRPDGLMSAEIAELLELPIEPAMLRALIANQGATNVDDQWEPRGEQIASLFGLEAITQNDLECRYYKREDDTAHVHVKGKLLGSVNGVATEIDVNGTFQFDLTSHSIKGASFTLHESRSIGQAHPGFDVTAKLEMRLSPLRSSPALADSVIAEWQTEAQTEDEIRAYKSELGKFEFLHNRQWHVISDRRPVMVLRLVDQGDLLAQCNISRLEDLGEGGRVSLDEFQRDVRNAVNANSGQVVDGVTETTSNGTEIHRVSATGLVSEVSIQWLYYHVTDDEGRRAALVVSVETDLIERFADAERLLVESLKFEDRNSDQPTEARGDEDE